MTSEKEIRRRSRQRGLSLVETAAVLAVAATAMGMFANTMADNADQAKAKASAEKMIEVQVAAQGYLKVNADKLNAAIGSVPLVVPVGRPDPAASPPASVPGHPELPSLQAGGFLTPSFIDRNGYNQRHALIVRKVSVTKPDGTTEQKLDAIVTTYGGNPIPERQLARIATNVGAAGGYVPRASGVYGSSSEIVGVQRGWSGSTLNWGASVEQPAPGSVVATLAYQDGTALNDFLYRNNIGVPEANRMNTAIDMNGNDVNAARNVAATGRVTADTVVAAGASTTGIASGEVRGINVWSQNTLTAGSRVVSNGTGTGAGGNWAIQATQGSIRSERDVSVAQNIGAGGSVTGSYVGASGNVQAGGNMHAQGFYGYSDYNYVVRPDGWSRMGGIDGNDIRSDIFYDRYNTGYYMQPRGTNRMNYVVTDNSYSYGWTQADVFYDRYNNGYYMQPRGTNRMNYVVADNTHTYGTATANVVTIAGVASAGAGCGGHPNGTIARTSAGALLSCVSGVWQSPGGGFQGTVVDLGTRSTSYSATNNTGGTIIVMAYNGGISGYNTCHLQGWSAGREVARQADSNSSFWKQCSITFPVGPGDSWRVDSTPHPTGWGYFELLYYR